MADQLNFFIVFYKTYQPPEWRPCPFIDAYGPMAPRPSDDFFLVGGRFSLISLGRGMGPLGTPGGSTGRFRISEMGV